MCSHLFLQLLLLTAEIVHLIVFTQGAFYGKTMFAEKLLIKPKGVFFVVVFLLISVFLMSNLVQILMQQMHNHTLESMGDRQHDGQFQFLTELEGLCLPPFNF